MILGAGIGLGFELGSGGATLFHPSDIDGMLLMLDADMGITLASGNVDSWASQVGSVVASAPAAINRPAYGANTLNGIDLLTFNGTDNLLEIDTKSIPSISTQKLPDGSGGDVGEGFTCTGLAYDSISDSFWVGNDGRNLEGDSSYEPSIVNISKDGSTKIDEILLSSLFPSAQSVQGVTIDTTDNTIWFASLAENLIRHVDKNGNDIEDEISYTSPNGLHYDSATDTLWVCTLNNNGTIQRINKSGVVQQTINVSYLISGTEQIDQIHKDGNYLWVTYGNSGSIGKIAKIEISSGYPIGIYESTDADAIEGIYVDSSIVYICSDGYFHGSNSNENRLVEFNKSSFLESVNGVTCVLVASHGTLTPADAIITKNDPVSGDSSGAWGIYLSDLSTIRIFINSNIGTTERDFLDFTLNTALTEYSVISVKIDVDSSEVKVYQNGVLLGTQSFVNFNGNIIASGLIRLAATYEDALYRRHLNLNSANFSMYHSIISDEDRTSVEVYLANKYGLAHPEADWVQALSVPDQIAVLAAGQTKDSYNAQESNAMILRLESDMGITLADTDKVETWADQSFEGNDAVAPASINRPIYGSNQLNEIDVLTFDGSNSYLDIDSFSPSGTIFIVHNIPSDDKFIHFFSPGVGYSWASENGNFSTDLHLEFGSPTFYVDGIMQSWNTRDEVHASNLGTHIISCVDFDSSNWTAFNIGWFTSTNFRLGGSIAAILIFNRALTTAQRQAIENYLNTKYNIY